jgi:hypothetical protein
LKLASYPQPSTNHGVHTVAPWQLVWQVRDESHWRRPLLRLTCRYSHHVLEGMQAPAVVFGSRLATRSASVV